MYRMYKVYLEHCIDNEVEEVLSYEDWANDLVDYGNYTEGER